MNETRELIIIGGGPAGYTAALYAARANLNPLVIEGFAWGGQLMITSDVENYPGYADGVLGPQMMQDFRRQAERFGAEFITDDVTKVDFSEHPLRVSVGDTDYFAEAVIVATGASARQLGLETERSLQGKGVSYCAVCDAAFFRDKEVVVVGGGDSAMEEAIFLTKFATKVSLVHRRDEFRASPIMVDRARANEKIEFVTPTVVDEVLSEDGQTSGVRRAPSPPPPAALRPPPPPRKTKKSSSSHLPSSTRCSPRTARRAASGSATSTPTRPARSRRREGSSRSGTTRPRSSSSTSSTTMRPAIS